MRAIPIENDEELNRLFTAISDDMATAAIHWRLNTRLRALVSGYLREFNQAKCFWSLTFQSHQDAALWRLCRLYDKSAGALSLPNFLRTLENHASFFDERAFRARLSDNPHCDDLAKGRILQLTELAADLKMVTDEAPLVDALINYRNKHIGHRDARIALGRATVPGLTYAQIESLIEQARDIVNHYSHLYRASVQSVHMIGEEDCESVLRAIRESMECGERSFVEETRSIESTDRNQSKDGEFD